MVTEETVKFKAEDLVRMLRDKYKNPNAYGGVDYVVLEQVPNGTGFAQAYRWIDAVLFSLIPSKGLYRSAYEIKVSRSDLIRELQNPEKHRWCQEYFHEFWFVCPKEIVQDGEIPNGIGLMCPHGDKLVIKKHCARNDNPKLDDQILAAFMRASSKALDSASKVAEKDILDNCKDYQQAKTYRECVLNFCEAHGVSMIPSSNKADIIKYLEESTVDKQLKQDRDHLMSVANAFQRDLVELFRVFAVVAHESILKRDELGNYVMSQYGGNDTENLEFLKQDLKSDRLYYNKQYVEILELIKSLSKEV